MKNFLFVALLFRLYLSVGLAQPTAPSIPVQVKTRIVGRDSSLTTAATVTTYSDSTTSRIMRDTTYLRRLTGRYLIGGSGPQATQVSLTPENTLRIELAQEGPFDLIPIIPILFELKGRRGLRVLFFVDHHQNVQGLNLIYDEPVKQTILATKQ